MDGTEVNSAAEPRVAGARAHKVMREVEFEGRTLAIPERRIHLDGGEAPLDLYDTTGPRLADSSLGLPKLRAPWIARRVASGAKNFSQMHYARRGIVTEEMAFAAAREHVAPEV